MGGARQRRKTVVASSTRPVVFVGPHCTQNWARRGAVLMGLDGSEGSETVAPLAASWARMLGVELRGAIVVHPLDVPYAEHPERLLFPVEQRLAARGISADLDILRATFVAGALVDHANDIAASMLAMTSHARAGLERLALGSVTMGVVNLARCPVVVTHAEEAHDAGRS